MKTVSNNERIFHLSHRNISRPKYRSVAERMAYSTGIEIQDEKKGKSYHKPSKAKKEGIETEMILNPGASEKFNDTNYFFNKMNAAEKRNDARVFNEMDVALFQDLSIEENKELAKQFCKDFAEKYNTPVSLSFHKMDSHNPHCHIVYSEREAIGEELSSKKIKEMRSKGYLKTPRKMWADRANQYFRDKEKDLFVDHRSHKERGLDKEPLQRYNKHSEIEDYEKVQSYNKMIKAENKAIDYRNKRKEIKLEREEKSIIIKHRKEVKSVERSQGQARARTRTKEQPAMAMAAPLGRSNKNNNNLGRVQTVHKLYDQEIKGHEQKFLEKRKEYKKQRERNKSHKDVFRDRKVMYKEQRQKSKNTIELKRGDIMELRLQNKDLKADLKGHSVFNPFSWKQRREIKKQIAKNKVKQKKKKFEIKKEKAKQRLQKEKYKEHRKDYTNAKKKEFGLLKEQIVNKLKAKVLNREKSKVVNKKIDNDKIISLKEYKKQHKIEKTKSRDRDKGRAM